MDQLADNIRPGGRIAEKEKFREYYKKIEKMWKKYKSGVSLEDISCLFGIPDINEVEQLLIHFKKLLNHEMRIVPKNFDARRKALREKYNFDSETIEYIMNGDNKIGIITEEQMREKLNSLYVDIKEGKSAENLKYEYNVTPAVIYELEDMDKERFEDFLEKIPNIKQATKKGNKIRIIAKELDCDTRLVSYVAKHICENYEDIKNNKKTSKSNSNTSMIQTNSLETQRRAGGVELE